MRLKTIVLGIFILLSTYIFGIDTESEENENLKVPIFSTSLGDADAELFIEGSWDMSLYGGFGYTFTPLNTLTTFPGITSGYAFEQVPDVTLSLLIQEKYFFDVSFLGGFDENSYSAGIQGEKEDFLQYLEIGNTPLAISNFYEIDNNAGNTDTPSLFARFVSNKLISEVLLRYDPLETQVESFLGMNKLTNYTTGGTDFIQGRIFLLPDTNVDNLKVYTENESGSFTATDSLNQNFNLEQLEASEYQYFPDSGEIILTTSFDGLIAVSYTKNGAEPGDDALGKDFLPSFVENSPDVDGNLQDFSWSNTSYPFPLEEYRLNITTQETLYTGLILKRRGSLSLLEKLNTYVIPEGTEGQTATAFVYHFLTEEKADGIDIFIDSENNMIQLNQSEDARALSNRYPLSNLWPQAYVFPNNSGSLLPLYGISLTIKEPVEKIQLASLPLENSLVVYRNNKKTELYTVDYTQGVIDFDIPLTETDEVEINYRSSGVDTTGGDIHFLSGNRLQFNNQLALDFSGEMRWNIQDSGYTTPSTEQAGSIKLETALEGDYEQLDFTLSAGTAFSSSDTTGLKRLESMDNSPLDVTLAYYTVNPSSLPLSFTSDEGKNYSFSLDERGSLFFTDYAEIDSSGTATYDIYSSDSNETLPYTSGQSVGPSIASGGSEVEGKVMVMDYTINDPGGWVAAQTSLSGGSMDLTDLSMIKFKLKENFSSDEILILQLGSLSEDLDQDNILDEESSPYTSGFSFNDQGMVLLQGNKGEAYGTKDSEDSNNNGLLDKENPQAVVSRIIDFSDLENWQNISLSLTEDEKRKLGSLNALRFIVLGKEGGETGSVYINSIELYTSTIFSSSTTVSTVQIPESELATGKTPTSSLSKEASVSFLDGSENSLLYCEWEDNIGEVTLNGLLSDVSLFEYKNVQFYLYAPELETSPITLTFSLKGPTSTVLQTAFSLAQGSEWNLVEIDMENEILYINGTPQSSLVNINFDEDIIRQWELTITGSKEGSLVFDEILLRNSIINWGYHGYAELSFTPDQNPLMIAHFPIFSLSQISTYLGVEDKISSVYTSQNSGLIFSYGGRTEMDIIQSLLILNIDGTENNSIFTYNLSHQIKIPSNPSIISLSDSFSRTKEEENALETQIAFKTDPFKITLLAKTDQTTTERTTFWSGDITVDPFSFLTFEQNFTATTEIPEQLNEDENYFSKWVNTYTYYVPSFTELNSSRNLSSQTEITGNFNIMTPSLSWDMTADITKKPAYYQDNSLLYQLNLPVEFLYNQQKMALDYFFKQEITSIYPRETQLTFKEDSLEYLNFLDNFQSSWFNWPFIQFFQPEEEIIFPEQSQIQNITSSTGIEFSRPFSSRISDLFVPSSLSADLKRTVVWNGSEQSDDLLLETQLKQTAINLFGRTGAYKTFDFYGIDEFNSLLNGSLNIYSMKYKLNASFNLSFQDLFKSTEDSFEYRGFSQEGTISQSLSLESDENTKETTSFSFRWNKPYTKPFIWLGKEIDDEIFFTNLEKIKLELSFDETYTDLSLFLEHYTSFVVTDLLVLKAWIKTGVKSTAQVQSFGLEGGIEGSLYF